jgi:hypothetical protein
MVILLPIGISWCGAGDVMFIILVFDAGLSLTRFVVIAVRLLGVRTKCGLTTFLDDNDDEEVIPVTFKLYHLTKFGEHASFAVILLLGPSFIIA